MEEIRGYVERIVYRNEENTYTVFELGSDGESFTCTGFLPAVSVGESCAVTGEYVDHPVYGRQLKVSEYRATAPENAQAMLRYLSSGAVKGIGEALALRIIHTFGDDTIRIFDEEPERLAEVKGISRRKARDIAAQMEEKRELRDAILFLQQYGVTNQTAARIWKVYGTGMYKVLKENPYQLAEDIRGIGFITADEIASRIGVRPDSDFRIRSGLLYVLSCSLSEGNSYLPRDLLIERTAALLQINSETAGIQLDNLAVERRLHIRRKGEDVQVYSNTAWREEQQIARMLTELDAENLGSGNDAGTEKTIRELEKREGIELDELQREAVLQAVRHAVLLISGGPGTGKTTTINTIIRYFEKEKMEVLLAAPTGRAAKRMAEAAGREAMTIHRMLGVHTILRDDQDNAAQGLSPGTETEDSEAAAFAFFEKDENDPLEADVLIIDEMSMVDMHLFYALLKAVQPGTRLILVGDVNQLPSVGPGRILQDLIDSGAFHTIVLRKIFRQALESDIVVSAHRILEGQMPVMDNHSRDFFFLERDQVPVIYKHTVQLLRDMLPGYVGCASGEIQVLTPMRKGNLGVNRLNEVLQSVLNPPAKGKNELLRHEVTFREGDKVMQTRNNYQIEWEIRGNFGLPIEKGTGIFNGDCGVIESIDNDMEIVTVRFEDDRIVEYPFAEMDDVEPAYAITVHKSQGSEYPAVILPLLTGPANLFNRNLLYTAVTRARKCVVILGSRRTLQAMIDNTRHSTRFTGLEDRIHEICGIEDTYTGDAGSDISEKMPDL